MFDALTDVSGIEVGHWQDFDALTGCTVVLCRAGATVGVDVRGAAPGTRETDLCRPGTLITDAHAIVLSGGSAFGLDAASGVMQYLWERGVGFDAGVTVVPIVPAAVLFDLSVGLVRWPDAAGGYSACQAAGNGAVELGCVGAGTGATVGKLFGPDRATKSGIGSASRRVGPFIVSALVAVNAFGNVIDPASGTIVAGARDTQVGGFSDGDEALFRTGSLDSRVAENTTIGVVATDAALLPEEVSRLALASHDGLARAIRPAHTMFDGDTMFALATGTAGEDSNAWLTALGAASAEVTARAVLSAVRNAQPAGGIFDAD